MRKATLASGSYRWLTPGSGGIGQLWGEVSADEATATPLAAALDGGIDVLDAAPGLPQLRDLHRRRSLRPASPAGVKVTTKQPAGHGCGRRGCGAAAGFAGGEPRLHAPAARRPLLPAHQHLRAGRLRLRPPADRQDQVATRWTQYETEEILAMRALQAEGKIGHWGITGIGQPDAVIRAQHHTAKPAAVQAIANLPDGAGALSRYGGPARPRSDRRGESRGCRRHGIRAAFRPAPSPPPSTAPCGARPPTPTPRTTTGAVPFRALCDARREDPAYIAHRYAPRHRRRRHRGAGREEPCRASSSAWTPRRPGPAGAEPGGGHSTGSPCAPKEPRCSSTSPYLATRSSVISETSKTIAVPIGSNEQHGPAGLPFGTDRLCPGDHRCRRGAQGARHPA